MTAFHPPARRRRLRTALTSAACVALVCGAVTALPASAAPERDRPARDRTAAAEDAAEQSLFDDFAYTGHDDPALAEHGWRLRSGGGGPGVPGADWRPENITFTGRGGDATMRLASGTDGTAAGTVQTELGTARKFRNGTYAARVRFSDAPLSGPDGDQVVQTFFTITPLDAPMDPDYGELDFEYLPNGGWGEPDHALFTTSWETYRPDPWEAVNTHTREAASFAGWHDLTVTVDDTEIRYYVDGRLFAVHGEPYLPETPMSVDFNQWFIEPAGDAGTAPRTYEQQVDYVFHAKDTVLTPDQVRSRVEAYRAAGVTFEDTVPGVR